ncbi:MAG: flagellar hook-basal body protein [Leptolinea sp.]
MIKGFYAAASAMVAGMQRQMALTHNIDNLDTPGFKQILVSMDDFMETPVSMPNQSSSSPGLPAVLQSRGFNKISRVGDLGLGVMTGGEKTDFSQGALQLTSRPLDVAIEGSGYFRISTTAGERFTKDGRFIKDATGILTTVDGNKVMAEGGGNITLPKGDISIGPDGQIAVNGVNVAKLGIAFFEKPEETLTRDGPNSFTGTGAQTGSTKCQVVQGAVETANADLTQIMTQMIQTSRAYEAAQRLVQTQDELLGRSINTLGRL